MPNIGWSLANIKIKKGKLNKKIIQKEKIDTRFSSISVSFKYFKDIFLLKKTLKQQKMAITVLQK